MSRRETIGGYTATVQKNGGWWIGWLEEVPGVNAQERTEKALLESLKIVLREALEFDELEGNKSSHSAVVRDQGLRP